MYERIITLDEDVELVWRRRWTGVTVLYAGLHVCVIAFLATALAGYFVVSCTVSGPFILVASVAYKQVEVSDECYPILFFLAHSTRHYSQQPYTLHCDVCFRFGDAITDRR